MALPAQSLPALQHRAAQPCRTRRHRSRQVARLLCRYARPAGDGRDSRHASICGRWKSAATIASCCERRDEPEARDLGFKVFVRGATSTRPQHFFKGKGLPVEWVERPYQARTFRTRDPHGIPLEFYSRMDRLPPIHQKYALYKGVKPLRIDHFNCFSPECGRVGRVLQRDRLPGDGIHGGRGDRARSGRPGCTARAACTTSPSPTARPAPAPRRLLGADAAQHHRPARPDGDHRLCRPISSAAPGGTAFPTPSSSTSAIPMATASRSTARTTRRSIRTSNRSSGT